MLRLSSGGQNLTPLSLLNSHHHHHHLCPSLSLSSLPLRKSHPLRASSSSAASSVEPTHLERESDGLDASELRKVQFRSPEVEVKELEDLPENWRRSRLAWLCKELPAHKRPTLARLLSAQKKWVRQEDATYLAVHCMRIRDYEAAFWVYKWMIQQHWFKFDFALATKLADCMGRERKFSKCREIFDDILNQGRVPSESTFHLLTVAYLSAPGEECLAEACETYNRMIHLGGYRPRLSLNNALFGAIVSQPGSSAKQHLEQAEFIFHTLVTCELELHKDIYGGLLWLHSYQDAVDGERISSLRKEMHLRGIEETRDVLLSVMRVCSKTGDVDEAEKTWQNLLRCDGGVPSQAYVYKMEVHAKVGDLAKSLEIFREMQAQFEPVNVSGYHKIIEVTCEAEEVDTAESLMEELTASGLKPLAPSYLNLLSMYFKLSKHDKVESSFFKCVEKCRANRAMYGVYLDSLVRANDIEKAESIFNHMMENVTIGVNSRSCNSILRAYLSCGERLKAEKIYGFMRQKNYEVDFSLIERLETVLRSSKKAATKPSVLKLTPEQREILVGLLLGGTRVERAGDKKQQQHYICFEFKDNCLVHSVLKRHIFDKFYEWLQPSDRSVDEKDDIPLKFSTVPHISFGFYADQFWPNGSQTIPKLIHRWVSPRSLAYWYMYSGHRTSAGDILLKVKGSELDVERVAGALKSKSLNFRAKQKGKVFWLGFLGSSSHSFWRLIEPHVFDELVDCLKADGQPSEHGKANASGIRFGSDSDSDDSGEPHR